MEVREVQNLLMTGCTEGLTNAQYSETISRSALTLTAPTSIISTRFGRLVRQHVASRSYKMNAFSMLCEDSLSTAGDRSSWSLLGSWGVRFEISALGSMPKEARNGLPNGEHG